MSSSGGIRLAAAIIRLERHGMAAAGLRPHPRAGGAWRYCALDTPPELDPSSPSTDSRDIAQARVRAYARVSLTVDATVASFLEASVRRHG